VHASDPVWARWQISPRGLRDVFASADVLCVQMAYYHRYRGLLGERLLPHCRSNQVIVSISPSALFDEVALARALDHGVIGAAWLDHVEPGALDPGRPLADARNLFVTPRLAGATRESVQRAAWSVVRRIDALLAAAPGEVPEFSSTGPGAGLGLSAGHALP
jgi:phosphoglycerate dehydrogenase-like enzyme